MWGHSKGTRIHDVKTVNQNSIKSTRTDREYFDKKMEVKLYN